MNTALDAFREADFNWVRPLESIWTDVDGNVAGPNEALADKVVADLFRETRSPAAKPNGRVFVGQPGIGKTHLVGDMRRKAWHSGGWFVLLDVLGLTDFWRSAALSFLTSLLQQMPDGRRQFEAVLAGIARRFNIEEQVETAFNRPDIDVRKLVAILVKALSSIDLPKALQHQDVFRALCLLRSVDLDAAGLAHSWLQGYDADEKARAELGFLKPPPQPAELVSGMSWIMSIAGPTLVAVDQIDGVVNPSMVQGSDDLGGVQSLAEVLAAGLLQLHDVRHRGKTVITCLFDSWKILEQRGLQPFLQRYEPEPIVLEGMRDASAVRALIVSRLAPAYEAASFSPPFPSWPFSERAIAEVATFGVMPRTILMRCDAFRRSCIERGAIEICESLTHPPDVQPPAPFPPASGYNAQLADLRKVADIGNLVAPGDDGEFGQLLRTVFDLYVQQIPPSETTDVESKGDPAQKIPPLHGRLTFTYHDQSDRELHYCFRALEHTNAISFQSRLRAALTASGISNRIADRHLLLVRRGPVPGGPRSRQLFDAFEKAGGTLINPSDEDLRTFVALRQLRESAIAEGKQEAFEAWLKADTPLLATEFFKQAGLSPIPVEPTAPGRTMPDSLPPATPPLGPDVPSEQGSELTRPDPKPKPPTPPTPPSALVDPSSIPVGRRMTPEDEPVSLPVKLLPRHTAIIAGSGSGKTVLLRRLVEEAALAGIPAIVIDPNNDLSRLGDSWPERPAAFTAEDDAKARLYRDKVEVVVWTPGIHAGNPLFLPVMPDFASVGDDRDERQQAVEMAAETLAPLAGATRQLQRGVLSDALRRFAAAGGGDLADFTALLADLPDGVSSIGNAGKLAAGMADQLHAAVATNPLLRAEGPVLDPKLLFFGTDPKRVRLSVINLSGLASDAAREDFVNRLQMTLFGWIKKNPSRTGLLYVVDEAQGFLPSQKPALSLGSGIKLVAQARKYGLGMIVATQAPRGIHNQIVSNCTTQFFGKQNAPATIGAAQEIIAASGGRADDIGKLKAGEFYFSTEGLGKPMKLRTPLCLTYHPANPPTPEEVIGRARQSVLVPA